jgi:UDP-glucose:(heptosyl)LPS alpha-1,3-glucosyltransferase
VTTVVQIAPEIGPGSGVAAVAHHLEAELARLGVPTARITLTDAYGSWLPQPGPGLSGKAALAMRVVWFSTVGSVVARNRLRQLPDAVAICHNDALAGEVYVNHGIVLAAMRARGHAALRMARNPLHLFTWGRDTVRFGTRTHRVVVNLTVEEDDLLRATYPKVAPATAVIGNGVDTRRLRPPSDAERAAAREQYGFGPDDVVVLFVGHEFDRKGLPVLVDAVAQAPHQVRLLVVGGTQDLVDGAKDHARTAGCDDRVHFAGRLADPTSAFHAADVFALPSAYESFGLVVLEALAVGLPVVVTGVGIVPEVVQDAVNGFVVEADAQQIRDRVVELAGMPRDRLRSAARATAEEHGWDRVARRYLTLLEGLGARFDLPADTDAGTAGTARTAETAETADTTGAAVS